MIPQVTHLDGRPALAVQQGELYIVPTVYGIPVICPSHIDDGNEGKTSKHWHTDDRFGNIGRAMGYWSKELRALHNMFLDDTLKASIIKDTGEPITFERLTAQKSQMWPSGGVFSTVCWLYEHLGTKTAKDGLCVHHGTPLVKQDGCFECPAHGLKFRDPDYRPEYNPPYFIATRWIDFDHKIHEVKAPLRTGQDGIEWVVKGNFDPFPVIRLEDSDGRAIMECKSDVKLKASASPGRTHTLTLSIGAWPSSGTCPQLAPTDPRNLKGT